MKTRNLGWLLASATILAGVAESTTVADEVALGGFIPFAGIAMTDESKTIDALDLGAIPFIADTALSPGAPLLGSGNDPYFDVALLDTGAATHIITREAFDGFDLVGAGLEGTNLQDIGGATGVITTVINDAAGFYTAGLGDRTAAGATLEMDESVLRGQTSVATLTAPEEWALPSILGLPMAAQHAIVIRNDQPQIFEHQGRTMRTPQVDFIDLGSGADEGILRRAPLTLKPGIGFVQGPQFVYNLDIDDILLTGDIDIANNPASPTVILDSNGNGGGLFLEVDMQNDGEGFEDKELLFDTGADLTVVSQITAKRLGFDAVLDEPDFLLEVEGSGGVESGIPGFYIDELNIDTLGGSFTVENVPIAVLDVTDPTDPGNIIDGIIGMHLFNGRNLVIDAEASFGQGGVGPSLYISDPVTDARAWTSPVAQANWTTSSNWSAPGTPDELWDVQLHNALVGRQYVNVSSDSTVFRLTVSSSDANQVDLQIESGVTLTTFGETRIEEGGNLVIINGKLDAQFVNIEGGVLRGSGEVFVGTGPINSAVRNLSGRIEVGLGTMTTGELAITGDLTNTEEGTLAIDLINSDADLLTASRFAFLAGTLEVTAFGVQMVGDTFTIITADEGVVGQFDTLMLPAGYTWDVSYLATSVVLEITGVGLEGDFNEDGIVDAADFTVWRDGYGTEYDVSDYHAWRDNFGETLPAAGSVGAPEPAAALLMAVSLAAVAPIRRARPRRPQGR